MSQPVIIGNIIITIQINVIHALLFASYALIILIVPAAPLAII